MRLTLGMTLAEFLPSLGSLNVYLDTSDSLEQACQNISNFFQVEAKANIQMLGDVPVHTFQVVKCKEELPSLPQTITSSSFEGFQQLACRHCSHPCLTAASLLVKDLPSSFWMELIDCWSCHKSEFVGITNSVVISEEGRLLPPKGNLFVGLDGYIVHKSHFDSDSTCCKCGSYLGELLDTEHIHIAKHSVIIAKPDEIIRPPSPLEVLMQRLHELIQVHGSYRFVIRGDDHILLTILNPNLVYLTDRLIAGMKVSYREGGDVDLSEWETVNVDIPTFKDLEIVLKSTWPSIQHENDFICNLFCLNSNK